jgi:hypothetical protein
LTGEYPTLHGKIRAEELRKEGEKSSLLKRENERFCRSVDKEKDIKKDTPEL